MLVERKDTSAPNCTAGQFRAACGKFPTGVTVTTMIGPDGEPRGITVGSFTSVSLDPPIVLVCIDLRSPMLKQLETGSHLGINILSEHQQEVSVRFSRDWDRRFENVEWLPGATGVPLLQETAAALELEIVQTSIAGDHKVIFGRVVRAACSNRQPLVYANRCYGTVASANEAHAQQG
jgi:flavin reductase (DIM6/NTAB) family NADH-FMN oxidoreductase RutF